MSKRDEILPLFPLKIRELLSTAEIDFDELREIRLRANQPLALRSGADKEVFLPREKDEKSAGTLRADGKADRMRESAGGKRSVYLVTPQDIRDTVELISRHSLYAFEEDVRRGFLTVPGGHRVGIAGKVVVDGERVAAVRNISFLNLRISHEVRGCAEAYLPYIARNMTGQKAPGRCGTVPDGCIPHPSSGNARMFQIYDICPTLILSGPGGGKTTLLRDLVRLLSCAGKNVSVIDERSEIAGCYQGIPGNDLGPRTDVLDGCPKAIGCRMALRSLAPDILAVDEIGGREDLEALMEVSACGCRILATMHAGGMDELKTKPFYKEMRERNMFERFLVRNHAVPVGRRDAWLVADGSGERVS